jgi:hypothetical protein
MLTETQSLAADIINLVPVNSTCFINAPSINDDSDILKLLQPSSTNHYDWQLTLTTDNKRKLIDVIISEGVEVDFHRLDIKTDNDFLFTAYDGFSGVKVTDKITVPDWFIKKYSDSLMF